jgi:Tol biopolymer transport system component/predicted Ser/Thr protein kinase
MAEGPGQLIARQYRLVEEIGRGGFGVVWRARDEHLHRDVAAKELFLPPHLDDEQRQEQRERSLREARSAARLTHRGVVTVYAVIEHDDRPWIIMELIDGRSLASLVRSNGPQPPRRVAEIGLEVLRALQAAHMAGVVHRDVKPGNILISDHRVVLTDFGIAMIEGDANLTQSGFIMGAPAYTAPERARGEAAVAASDLWSLGASLYYAVEGRRPFAGANAQAVFHSILTNDPAPLRRAGPLTPLIHGLLRKDPAERLTAEAATELLGDAILGDLPWEDEVDTPPGGQVRADRREPATADVRTALSSAATDGPAGATPPTPTRGRFPAARSDRRRRAAALTAVPVLAAAIAVGVVGSVALRADDHPRQPPQTSAAQQQRSSTAARSTAAGAIAADTTARFTDAVNSVAFSPDGATLAVGGEGRALALWDVRGRRWLQTLSGPMYNVFATAFSPDGAILATGGYDGDVQLWDTARRTRIATLSGGANSVSTIAFSPDGKTLASASDDAVRLWSVPRRALTRTLPTRRESVFITAFSPTGRTLATAGTQALRLWDAASGRSVATVTRLSSVLNGVAFSPDGKFIATAGYNGRVELWNVAARRRLATVATYDKSAVAVAFAAKGNLLASAEGNEVLVWDTATRRRVATITEHTGTVKAVSFSPDGRVLATGGEDKTVRLWDVGGLSRRPN